MFKIKNIFSRSFDHIPTLEIAITDFCNLACPLCAQGTPFLKVKKTMSLEKIRDISKYFASSQIIRLKISGGEPTLHPEFAQICRDIRSLFPAQKYVLATNGHLLEKYRDEVKIFDEIELSKYPGLNDEVYEKLCTLNFTNLKARVMHNETEMMDIFKERNKTKRNIFQNCCLAYPPKILKIVQERIYPCCIVFGLAMIRQGIDLEKISVALDQDWQKNLARLNIEDCCRICFYDVPTQKSKLYCFMKNISR